MTNISWTMTMTMTNVLVMGESITTTVIYEKLYHIVIMASPRSSRVTVHPARRGQRWTVVTPVVYDG
eukprot:SAG31_NODE_43438_length_267_cov_0.613095_1_plen_67_part_00